ncbi:MAG: phosphomannomutase/phosphoglucomutase [Candidatus Saccharimonadales bacterium]
MASINLASIFKAYDIRGKVGSELNSEFVNKIGRGFADWLPTAGIVAVGHDMRPDSRQLADAFIEGLSRQGRDVWDIGEVTSDMIYFAVGKFNLAGGAVITASHNPGEYNGIKLYRDQVIAVGLDAGLSEIRDKVIAGKFNTEAARSGKVERRSITDDWVLHCLSFVKQLKPFNIAIDAGNGMAGAILPHILPKLPIHAMQMYFDLDGTFPNHEANPQKPENLADLIQKVKQNGLDFGIAFDGDGDRAGFVDDKGRPVQGSDLISLVAKLYLTKYPGSEVIHEVRTSRATQELIREWGGKPFRTKAGRVVIGTVMREHQAPFGGETTGHLFFKENYYADSGLIAALVAMQAISYSGKKLSELVDEYHRYSMITETNFEVDDTQAVLAKLKQAFADGQQDELDGLSVNYPDMWFNIRISNTEPVIRLNAEANTQKTLDELVKHITQIVDE